MIRLLKKLIGFCSPTKKRSPEDIVIDFDVYSSPVRILVQKHIIDKYTGILTVDTVLDIVRPYSLAYSIARSYCVDPGNRITLEDIKGGAQ